MGENRGYFGGRSGGDLLLRGRLPDTALIFADDVVKPRRYPPYADYGNVDSSDHLPSYSATPAAQAMMRKLMDSVRLGAITPSAEPPPPPPIQIERKVFEPPPPEPTILDLPRIPRSELQPREPEHEKISMPPAVLRAAPAPRRKAVEPGAALAAALMAEKKRQDDAKLVNDRLLANAAYISALKPYAHYRVFPGPPRLGLGLMMQGHADFAQNLQNAMNAWGAMNQAMLEAQNRRREAMAAPAAMALRTAAMLDALGGRGNFAATMQRLFG